MPDFQNYWKYFGTIYASYEFCCYLCDANPNCYLFDYDALTRSCVLYDKTTLTDTSRSRQIYGNFYQIYADSHTTGIYYE